MAISANRLELLQIADAVAREKAIDRSIVITAMEDAIAKAARSRYGAETDVHADINAKTGDLRLSRHMLVVETVENPANQISLESARRHNPAAQLGDTIADQLPPLEYGRIAAQSAFVATGYARIALSGDYGIAWLLTRLVGTARARELLFTGDRVDAARAEAIGLVNRVVAPGAEREEALKIAKIIASKSAVTVKIGKEAFYRQLEMPLAEAYKYASEVMVENMLARDAAEGIGAFIEKREPKWQDK